jgi:long-chain fatty acid transport protein
MGRLLLRPVGMALALAAMAAPVLAQGSSVYTQSACVSARGGAAVAAPCADASGVYYNPAALALMPSAIAAGFTAVNNRGAFTYDTTGAVVERDPATPIVPHAYATHRFGGMDRFAVGLGFFAPYGLGIEWPQDFEGRFVSWKTQLRGLYLQPTIAYQLVPGRLAIGGGPQVVLGGIELNQHLDAPLLNPQLAALGIPLGTDVAQAVFSGSGTGVGAQLALYYEHNERLAFGARYMHSVKVDLSGDGEFSPIWNPDRILSLPDGQGGTMHVPLDSLMAPQFRPGGPLVDQAADASITFPAQAVVGVRFAATPLLSLAVDYQWTGWSSFDEIRAQFEGGNELVLPLAYEDAHTFRVGGMYQASPELTVRGGFSYNTAATPDQTVTPILPEAERQLYGFGLGYRFGSIQADAFYNFVNQADRRGRVRGELPGGITGADLNVGVYSANVHLFGLTLSYVFDAFRTAR